jgi:hypothetical protein
MIKIPSTLRAVARTAVLVLGLLLVWDRVRKGAGVEPGVAAQLERPRASAYPRGRWRLASRDSLETALLSVSHLLIRYRDADSSVPFSLAEWRHSGPLPDRSREEAQALAERLGRELRAAPDRFADSVREYSEDSSTRALGGTLGTVPAFQLSPWEPVLDALAALRVGEVSSVVETSYGFHLFLRRPPPAEQLVSGARLVIGHDDARWLHQFQARRPIPARSYQEALSLARALSDRAREDPAGFPRLVAEYSDARDAERGGDIGTWSTREALALPREIEALSSLAEGEFAWVESSLGLEVLQRTPNRPRQSFAATALGFMFDPSAPDAEPLSLERVRAVARATAREVAGDPARISILQRTQCCPGVLRWKEPELEEWTTAVQQLAFGEVTLEPVQSQFKLTVLQRLDPDSLPARELQFELPSPAHPDVADLLAHTDALGARLQVETATRRAVSTLGLSAREAAWMFKLHEPWQRALRPELDGASEAEADARRAAFDELQRSLEVFLGAERHARYWSVLNDHFEEQILKRPADPPSSP